MSKKEYIHYDTTRLNGIPISRVAEFLGMTLKRRGTQYWTTCLWHDDHSPSLVMIEKNGQNFCHCFVCGKSWSAIDLTMQHQGLSFQDACEQLSNQFGIPVIGGENRKKHVVLRKVAPKVVEKPPVTYIPINIAVNSVTKEDNFSKCLYQLFDAPVVDYVCEEYLIGNYDGKDLKGGDIVGGTIFWMIDEDFNLRNGKMQVYESNINSEQFFHFDRGDGRMQYIGWQLARDGTVAKNAKFDNNCLFGAHLLKQNPNTTVVLVESPKNALLGACYKPEYIWVAAGSMSMLKNEDVVKPLRNRKVIVIPDRDAISAWRQDIDYLRTLANFYVSDICERIAPADQQKYDIADYIIEQRMPYAAF